jgi:hypothetical protein
VLVRRNWRRFNARQLHGGIRERGHARCGTSD